MASMEKERISEEVHNAQFLCVLADGSTDKSITEQEAVYVRYTAPNGRPTTQFAEIVALESAGLMLQLKKDWRLVGKEIIRLYCCIRK